MNDMRVVSALIRMYLSVFVWLVSDRRHARSEHDLIVWSIEDSYRRELGDGHSSGSALAAALTSHLPELAPLALYRKTLTDQASAPNGAGHLRIGRIAIAGVAAAIMIGLVWGTLAGVFRPAQGLHLVAQARPEREGATAPPNVLGPYDSQTEALAAIGAGLNGTSSPSGSRSDGYEGRNSTPRVTEPHSEPKGHCVVRVAPLAPDSGESVAAPPVCFDTLEASVLDAAGSAAAFDIGAQVQTLITVLSRPTALRVIGLSFAEPRYLAGGTIIWVADNNMGCATGLAYAIAVMPEGWDDVVSSAIPLGGCGTFTHYELTAFSGTRIDCTCDAMVAMDGLTSSIRWSP